MELIVSVLAGFLIVEVYSWLPCLSKWLLERAVRRVRAEDRDRCREEWNADLDALPNTMVRIFYAFRYFSIGAADMINANFFEEKCNEVDYTFETFASQHQKLVEDFRKATLEHERSRGKVALAVAHALSSLEPRADLVKLRVSLDQFGHTLVRATDRTYDLLSVRINNVGSRLDHIDSLLKVVSKKRDELIELLQKKNISSDVPATILRGITDDLETIKSILDKGWDDWDDDESAKEFTKINAAIESVCQNFGIHLTAGPRPAAEPVRHYFDTE